MLDIKFIRQNPDVIRNTVEKKRLNFDVDKLLAVDERRRHVLQESEQLKAEQNRKSKGKLEPAEIDQLKIIKEKIKVLESELDVVEKEFIELMMQVPNIPTDDTPVGASEKDNSVVKEVGKPTKFDFPAKNHWDLAQDHDLIDKSRAAEVAGARFAYIKGDLVKMQFALIQFTIDQLTNQKVLRKIIKENKLQVSDKPFVPVLPPP